LWFGTGDGLNKYDGYRFSEFNVFYSTGGQNARISHGMVNAICEDHDGNLWIGTGDGGLNKLDRVSGRVSWFRHNADEPDSLGNNAVRCLARGDGDELWIGTEGGGLNHLDIKTGKCSHFKVEEGEDGGISSNLISCIVKSRVYPGVLWIGTGDGGLNRLDVNTNKFTVYKHEKGNPRSLSVNQITSIFEGTDGLVWLTTWGGGLNKFDPATGTFSHYRAAERDPKAIGTDRLNTVYLDETNRTLWVGTFGEGIYRAEYNPGEPLEFKCYKKEPGQEYGLSSNYILSFLKDRSGAFWIGTWNGGLCKVVESESKFIHCRHNPGNSLSIAQDKVFALAQDRKERIWCGTFDKGLSVMSEGVNGEPEFVHFRHSPVDPDSLCCNEIKVIYEDRRGDMWIGTRARGLDRYDPDGNRFVHYSANPGNPTSISSNYVTTLFEDLEGTFWVGTWGGGLMQMNRDTGEFTPVENLPSNGSLRGDTHINIIFQDKKGWLWVGTYGGGLLYKKPGQSSFNPLKYGDDPSMKLNCNYVLSLYEDAEGLIWVGTFGGGLNCIDREKKLIRQFLEIHGLANNVIYGIMEDKAGFLWMSTNKGLSRFDKQQIFANFDVGDGLQDNEFNSGAYLLAKDGRMLFGGANGITMFRPKDITINELIAPVVMTDFKLFHHSVKIGRPTNDGRVILNTALTECDEIDLSYKDNIITFEISVLHYVRPERNRYAYILHGFETSWNVSGNRRTVTYTNLPPGEYVFKAKGANNDGRWNPDGVMMKIRIAPPYWKTWWFTVLMLLLVAFILLLAHNLRTAYFRKQNKQLQEMNARLNEQIRERRKAEGALQESEEKYRMVLENIDHAIVVTGRVGEYKFVSPKLIELVGYPEEEIKEQGLSHFAHPEDRDELVRFYKKSIKRRQRSLGHIFRIVRNDGSIRWIEINSLLLQWFGEPSYLDFIKDITDRKLAEEQLKSTRNYLKNVFNSLPSVLVSIDVEGNVTGWNTAAENFSGVSASEAIGKKIWDKIPYFKDYESYFSKVVQSQRQVKLLRQNIFIDEKKYLNISISPLVSQATDGVVVRIDDVTELEKKDEQLRQAQRMETVGTLAGGLAHDFNNVLGGILGTISLMNYALKKQGNLNLGKIKQNINTIEKAASRAADMVQQLLALSRKQEFAFSPVDLVQSVNHVIGICKNTFDKTIRIKLFVNNEGAVVNADATQIEQVLLNLCVNASHAMTVMRKPDESQGGTLIVSIEKAYNNEYFRSSHPEAKGCDYWGVRVMDTGVGMDSEIQMKMFDPFFTTKDKSVGTGLGLAMVYNIVKQHKGFIDVYSQLNIGTTFSVFLPVLDISEAADTAIPSEEVLDRGTGKILLVDDEEIIQETARDILTECGYDVVVASNGQEALKIFTERNSEIRAVILDMAMPNMSGRETFMELKKISPKVKVLLASGFKNDSRIIDTLKMGVAGFIQKPYTLHDLSKKVTEILK
jgi:PAS domain S-box-containing protein